MSEEKEKNTPQQQPQQQHQAKMVKDYEEPLPGDHSGACIDCGGHYTNCPCSYDAGETPIEFEE